jgi:putative intracellular protease/amidase
LCIKIPFEEEIMKILEVITDGFEELEAIGTIAILRRAGLEVTLAGISAYSAKGRYDVDVDELVNLDTVDPDDYGMLIIPGGPEYVAEENNPDFLNLIKKFHSEDKYLCAICAGPTILGHLGLLKGKKYTCFTSMNEEFGGTYLDQYTVTDGKLITGRSCAATVDFALAIVTALKGQAFTNRIKDSIYY